MKMFSPETIYERGRNELAANQSQFRERFQRMISDGVAIYVHNGSADGWLVCAPASRLEGQTFLAYDLAREGDAGLMSITFEEISFIADTWGWLLVAGSPVADFRPLSESEDEDLVALWNTRSGRPPVQLVEF